MRKLIVLSGLLVLLASPVRADVITAGSLVSDGGFEAVRISLSSPSFVFGGGAAPIGGVWGPADCVTMFCVNGSTIDLTARWSGKDLPGSAVWNGVEYSSVGSLSSDSSLSAEWLGSLLIPTDFSGGVLTAPFTFSGTFWTMNNGMTSLFGSGTTRASLVRRDNGSYSVDSIYYEFEDAVPNPEPGTLILLGTGAALIARRVRRTERRCR